MEDLKKYIMSKVKEDPETGCWEWQGSRKGIRYSMASWKSKQQSGHRLSYMAFKGPIPSDRYVCHECDNTFCLNPEHLWLGSPRQNSRDAKKKGRLMHGEGNYNSKLTEAQVLQIMQRFDSGEHPRDVAKDFPVTLGTISKIYYGYSWQHLRGVG